MKRSVTLTIRKPPVSRSSSSASTPNPLRLRRARAVGTEPDRVAVGTRPPGRASARRNGRPNSRIGASIGDYGIVRRLGSGGTSVVYLARHAARGRAYALKVMRRHVCADPDMVERFEREAELLAALAHPGLPRLVDRGRTDDGAPYLVLSLLVGQTLAERLDLGPMTLADILDIAHQASDVLCAVHAAGIVHGDLKPDNIFLTPNPLSPSGYRVVIIDFGVATAPGLGFADPAARCARRRVFGTPSYMAPEQFRTAAELDLRTDVYGFGCLLYEMLCGQSPFEGSVAEILNAHESAERPRASALRPETPDALDELILGMLARDPNRRTPSMTLVRTGLGEAMARPAV